MLGSSTSEQSDREFDAKVWEFVTVVKKMFETSSKLMSIPPRFADKVNMKVYREFESAVHRSITLCKSLNFHFTSLFKFSPTRSLSFAARSLISILSNDMQSSENGLLWKMKSQHLSDDVIVRVFSDLIIAAGDTVSLYFIAFPRNLILLLETLLLLFLMAQTVYTTQWLLHSIAKDTALAATLKKDIADNPENMEVPLVRGCLRETLRLYPVAPFIGRILEMDAQIGNYSIPKGVLALASLYTSGRDAVNFVEPLSFIPDRWLRDGNKEQVEQKVLKPHATIPFAMGSRSCVGKKIATHQIHSLITKVKTISISNARDRKFKYPLLSLLLLLRSCSNSH
jgi:ecdysteroid 2-hydroxylase